MITRPASVVPDRLRAQAACAPQRWALDDGRRRTSYGELVADVDDLARRLRRQLPQRGTGVPTVGLLLRAPTALLTSFSAATVAGCAAMVLDPAWSTGELAAVLASSPPDVLLADPAGAVRVAGLLPAARVHVLDDDGCTLAAAAADVPLPEVPGEQAFYVGFTSGTTGTPKGFVRSHSSWIASFDASGDAFRIGAGDVVVACGPLQHSLFCYAAVHGLSAGAQVHVRSRFSPEEVLDLLGRHAGSSLYAVPTMLAALARAAEQRGPDGGPVPDVRTIISAGAPLAGRDERRISALFPGAAVVEFFGASELSFVTLRRSRDGTPPGSVGRPFPGVEVSIRDDADRALRPGQVGRVAVRSPMVFSGYLHEGALAGGHGARTGWTSVGDIGWRDADGHLFLVGREGSMVLSGGVNVYPEEVEAVLTDLPQVADAAVVGLPDATRGALLCAVVVWQPGSALPCSALRAQCRSRLAPAKRPRRYLVAADLPRTPSGKASRASVREALLAGALDAEPL